MQYHQLGSTGMRVSSLCLGTMTFGREASQQQAAEMIAQSFDAGVNFIDAANIYAGGASEEIIGACLKPQQDRWILATKACQPVDQKGPNDWGASRRHLRLQLEASLRRLQRDWVDLFYIHIFDPTTALDETMRALDDFVREGKVLSVGVSNFSAWQTMKAQGVALRRGGATIQAIQPMYSLLKRQAEVELLPMAQSEGMSVFPYSPLGAGMLTGKYDLDKTSQDESARLQHNNMYAKRYAPAQYYQSARAFVALAQERGVHPVTLAISWVMAHPAVTAPILGARHTGQLTPALEAATYTLDDDLYQRIAALSPTPAPATDRLEQQEVPSIPS